MSTTGAIADFTQDEKRQFRGLYAKYVTLQLDDQQVLNALGGNEQTYEKFKAYTHLMRTLLTSEESDSRNSLDDIAAPSEFRQLLIQQIQLRIEYIKSRHPVPTPHVEGIVEATSARIRC